jgi:hypothetical protein
MDSGILAQHLTGCFTQRLAMADIAFKMAVVTIAFKMVVVTILRRVISKDHLMKMQGIHHSVISTRIPRKTECRAIQEQADFMRGWQQAHRSEVQIGCEMCFPNGRISLRRLT